LGSRRSQRSRNDIGQISLAVALSREQGLSEQLKFLLRHRLAPFADLLEKRGLVSGELAQVSRNMAARKPAVSPSHFKQEARVASKLALEPMDALIMKGSALAAGFYSDPLSRVRTDMDVLVPFGHVNLARSALREMGYKPTWSMPSAVPLFQEQWSGGPHADMPAIDLHWEIRNHPVLTGIFDHDELLAEAMSLPKLGPGVRGLGAVHALLISAMHWFVNPPSQRAMVWLLDSELLWQAMTAAQHEQLLVLARDRGVAGLLGAHLAQCRVVLKSPIPENVTRELIDAGRHQQATRLIRASQSDVAYAWFELVAERGWRDRLNRLRFLLFPSAAYMRQSYPEGTRLGLPALYLRRLLSRLLRL